MNDATHPSSVPETILQQRGDGAAPSKTVLTFSAANTLRSCQQKYDLRNNQCLRPREKADVQAFGHGIHESLELWYRLGDGPNRLWNVLDLVDSQYPMRLSDPSQKAAWHLARAMVTGYAARYATEDFEVVEVEKTFTGQIRNPETGRPSKTFTIAGKVDAIVRRPDGLYLMEHKTASSLDANYLDRLWTDTQIALYAHYLRQTGYPIAHSAENELRSYLAQFGLTHHQMNVLIEAFGPAVVGVLRADPYQLIRHVPGYGFKRVDKIALAMGTPKDHRGRLEAGLLHVVANELSSGHTWTAGADLLDKANGLLVLDTLDSRPRIPVFRPSSLTTPSSAT